jgi:hypothetical protein
VRGRLTTPIVAELQPAQPTGYGHRSRIWIIDEIISAAKAKGSVWFATHAEIAAYCATAAGLTQAEQRGTPPRPGGAA